MKHQYMFNYLIAPALDMPVLALDMKDINSISKALTGLIKISSVNFRYLLTYHFPDHLLVVPKPSFQPKLFVGSFIVLRSPLHPASIRVMGRCLRENFPIDLLEIDLAYRSIY